MVWHDVVGSFDIAEVQESAKQFSVETYLVVVSSEVAFHLEGVKKISGDTLDGLKSRNHKEKVTLSSEA